MSKVIISFVVPVYNTKIKDFERCINSIMKLDGISFEIIIVDDGSELSNSEKYKDFLIGKESIKYFRNDNKGVSSARNFGIEQANGLYITFVDSDDEFIADEINHIEFSEEYDYIVNDFYKISGQECTIVRLDDLKDYCTCENVLELMISTSKLNTPWAKFFRADFVKKHKICFNSQMNQGEDLYFNLLVVDNNPKVYYSGIAVYKYYYDRSTTRNRWINHFNKTLNSINSLYEKEFEICNNCKYNNYSFLFKEANRKCVSTYRHIYSLMIKEKKYEYLDVLSTEIKKRGIETKALNIKEKVGYFLISNNFNKMYRLFMRL